MYLFFALLRNTLSATIQAFPYHFKCFRFLIVPISKHLYCSCQYWMLTSLNNRCRKKRKHQEIPQSTYVVTATKDSWGTVTETTLYWNKFCAQMTTNSPNLPAKDHCYWSALMLTRISPCQSYPFFFSCQYVLSLISTALDLFAFYAATAPPFN